MKSLFSSPTQLNRVSASSAPESCAVYKLLDHGGYVLYVGWAKEGQLRKRIVERRVAPEASAFCYKLCAMETEAEREKEKPTVEYMPRYNQQTR